MMLRKYFKKYGPIKKVRIIEDKFGVSFAIDYDWFYLRQTIIFTILVSGVSLLYYALPNVKQNILRTLPGAILTVFLWILLEKLFSTYCQIIQL